MFINIWNLISLCQYHHIMPPFFTNLKHFLFHNKKLIQKILRFFMAHCVNGPHFTVIWRYIYTKDATVYR
jgi:hypothetical protein